ncbi:MAG: YggU family protein [Myxococcales bacterium]|nr:MAG: YggU family protein [Myxococcales bacterium]
MDELPFVYQKENAIHLRIRVNPRASNTRALSVEGDYLKVALNAPPVDGAANKELIAFLSKQLGVSKKTIALISGQRHRNKVLRIAEVSTEHIHKVIDSWQLASK